MRDSPSATTSDSTPSGSNRRKRFVTRLFVALLITAIAARALWAYYGQSIWKEYQILQTEVRASEDNAPVGYVGLNYRRSYNDRPVIFETEKEGRKLLFAIKGEGPSPEYYDVTGISIDLKCLDGGYGRDSIPGVDFPIVEKAIDPHGRSLRKRQLVFGTSLKDVDRAYPKDLLEKIEVVNDQLGSSPVAVIYDRSQERALLFDRTVRGQSVTFGTTGYSCEKRPLLYDRRSKSLWIPKGDALVCVNGEYRGETLPVLAKPEPVSWSDWKQAHSKTDVLVGNNRNLAIPLE